MGLFGKLQDHYRLQTALEVKCDLRIEISEFKYICCHVYQASNCLNFKNQIQELKEVNRDPLTLACFGKKQRKLPSFPSSFSPWHEPRQLQSLLYSFLIARTLAHFRPRDTWMGDNDDTTIRGGRAECIWICRPSYSPLGWFQWQWKQDLEWDIQNVNRETHLGSTLWCLYLLLCLYLHVQQLRWEIKRARVIRKLHSFFSLSTTCGHNTTLTLMVLLKLQPLDCGGGGEERRRERAIPV